MTILSIERTPGTRKVSWLTLLGIVLVPLVISGLLVWALWSPTERLDQITAAVVNEDAPVEIDGRTIPLGRQLAAELVTGGTEDTNSGTPTHSPSGSPATNVSGSDSPTNFTWVLTDKDAAAAGLADGSYATVVTIPAGFSAAATSYSGDAVEATKATIDIATSDKSKLVDDAISASVTDTATAVLNSQLTAAYLQNVYVGFNSLNDQLGEASDGAGTLADGTDQLSVGASSLAEGAGALATGLDELQTGVSSLSDGVAQLDTGAASLSGGVSMVASGAQQSNDAANQLATGTASLADGLDSLASGVAALGDTATVGATLAGQAATTTRTSLSTIAQLAASCAATDPNCAAVAAEAVRQLDPTNQAGALYQSGAAAQYASGISVGINTGTNGQPSLVVATTHAAGGAREVETGAGTLASGLSQLSTGALAAADGAAQLATGAASASDGAAQLAAGASSAADRSDQLADGTNSVSDGAVQVDDGAQTLATGLNSAVAQLPTYTDAESKNLADVVADPVEKASKSTELFGASSVPYFATLALWLGALATFLVLAAYSRRALSLNRCSAALAISSYIPALAIGIVQGLAVAIVMIGVADLDVPTWIRFALLSMLVGASFAAVNQGLVAMLGGIGRFISMLAAVIGLSTGIISTVPGVFDDTFARLPLSAAQSAFSAVVGGSEGVGGALIGLVVWLLLGLLLTIAAIARKRVTSVRALRRQDGA